MQCVTHIFIFIACLPLHFSMMWAISLMNITVTNALVMVAQSHVRESRLTSPSLICASCAKRHQSTRFKPYIKWMRVCLVGLDRTGLLMGYLQCYESSTHWALATKLEDVPLIWFMFHSLAFHKTSAVIFYIVT